MPRLRAIREPRMRVLALARALADHPPAAWIAAFAEVLVRPDDADADAAEAITQAIAEPTVAYEVRQALYEAAVAAARPALARLFLTASPSAIAPEQLERALAPERPLKPTGRPLMLGERKALARTHRRDQLLLLVRDPHPAVVAVLLDNPHLTESDVVRIAAMRPAVPESLARIAIHPKWSVRHQVKRALVFNPATPLADALRIATTLRPGERAELAHDPAVPELLRQHLDQLR